MMASLTKLVAEELAIPVDPRISAFAANIAARYPDGAAQTVIFYGSCLRSEKLEGEMLDFYLIVSDYQTAYGDSWMVRANEMIPPNVFPAQHDGLAAKYAVLSEHDFHRLNRVEADTVSVWARFSQPSRLVWSRDEAAADRAAEAIAGAALTLLTGALAHMESDQCDALELWERGYALTYGAELRAERSNRSQSVVDFDPDRYRRFTSAALAGARIRAELEGDVVQLLPGQETAIKTEQKRWPALRRRGKWMTLARLAKASATYAGGIDYLAWKINRHAGTEIAIKPWQRKWPILGAMVLLPRLLLKGAVR
ncbi:MAG: hypothetical protein AAGH53_11970 [Pseudomonadota bacterium]